MRAIAMTGFDAAPTLTDLDVPEPKEGEVRVRIRAASVNGFDLAVAAGYTKDYMEHRFPLVLGKDFAGEVDALGAGVTGYAMGDRVFGTVTKPYLGDGSFAEYVTIPTAVGLAPLPESISFTDAAALGLAGAAAHGILDALAVQPGHTVLVIGATGGVGKPGRPAGRRRRSARDRHRPHRRRGRAGPPPRRRRSRRPPGRPGRAVARLAPDGVDAVAHLAGDPSSVALVRDGGRFASTLVQSPDQVPTETVTVVPVYANPSPQILASLAANQASGRATVTIQHTYPLAQAQDAFDAFAQGTLGKIVVTIG